MLESQQQRGPAVLVFYIYIGVVLQKYFDNRQISARRGGNQRRVAVDFVSHIRIDSRSEKPIDRHYVTGGRRRKERLVIEIVTTQLEKLFRRFGCWFVRASFQATR